MKISIKTILIIFVLLTSAACSLPFLAGDSSDAEPTEDIRTEMPTPAQTTTAEATDGVDPCLVGVWIMDTNALNNKFLDLTHSPNMYVVEPSAMTLELSAEGNYVINGETIVRADIPNGSDYMQMTGTHSGEGRYSADGSSVFLSDSTYTVVFGTMTMNINGVVAEAPVSTFTLPENFMSPPSTSAYVCSTNSLQITYESPSGPITEEWAR